MGGGTSDSAMNANGQVAFNPTSIGGGNIAVGGSVGNGGVNQVGQNSATGSSTSVGLSMPFPMMNLKNHIGSFKGEGTTNFKGKKGHK